MDRKAVRTRWNERLPVDEPTVDPWPGNNKLAMLPWEEPFKVLARMVWHEDRWQFPLSGRSWVRLGKFSPG